MNLLKKMQLEIMTKVDELHLSERVKQLPLQTMKAIGVSTVLLASSMQSATAFEINLGSLIGAGVGRAIGSEMGDNRAKNVGTVLGAVVGNEVVSAGNEHAQRRKIEENGGVAPLVIEPNKKSHKMNKNSGLYSPIEACAAQLNGSVSSDGVDVKESPFYKELLESSEKTRILYSEAVVSRNQYLNIKKYGEKNSGLIDGYDSRYSIYDNMRMADEKYQIKEKAYYKSRDKTINICAKAVKEGYDVTSFRPISNYLVGIPSDTKIKNEFSPTKYK